MITQPSMDKPYRVTVAKSRSHVSVKRTMQRCVSLGQVMDGCPYAAGIYERTTGLDVTVFVPTYSSKNNAEFYELLVAKLKLRWAEIGEVQFMHVDYTLFDELEIDWRNPDDESIPSP